MTSSRQCARTPGSILVKVTRQRPASTTRSEVYTCVTRQQQQQLGVLMRRLALDTAEHVVCRLFRAREGQRLVWHVTLMRSAALCQVYCIPGISGTASCKLMLLQCFGSEKVSYLCWCVVRDV